MQVYKFHTQHSERFPRTTRQLRLLTGWYWYDRTASGTPYYDTSHISERAMIRGADHVAAHPSDHPICFDIESFDWVTDFARAHNEVDRAIKYYRNRFPYRRIGAYGFMPKRDYWSPVNALKHNKKHDRYEKWKAHNLKWLSEQDEHGNWSGPQGICDQFDISFPSLYTFYTDQAGWQIYARANVAEARKYQKPIIPWIWPMYHAGGQFKRKDFEDADPPKPRPYIGDDYFKMQLEFLEELEVEAVCIYDQPFELVPDSAFEVLRKYMRAPSSGPVVSRSIDISEHE